jgi:hypothetical protein
MCFGNVVINKEIAESLAKFFPRLPAHEDNIKPSPAEGQEHRNFLRQSQGSYENHRMKPGKKQTGYVPPQTESTGASRYA